MTFAVVTSVLGGLGVTAATSALGSLKHSPLAHVKVSIGVFLGAVAFFLVLLIVGLC